MRERVIPSFPLLHSSFVHRSPSSLIVACLLFSASFIYVLFVVLIVDGCLDCPGTVAVDFASGFAVNFYLPSTPRRTRTISPSNFKVAVIDYASEWVEESVDEEGCM